MDEMNENGEQNRVDKGKMVTKNGNEREDNTEQRFQGFTLSMKMNSAKIDSRVKRWILRKTVPANKIHAHHGSIFE
jgi:hypothetical protein